jgi:hypothetical protein
MIANWALVVVVLNTGHVPDPTVVFATWETLGIFETRQACFAALEREQLAHDRVFAQYPKTVIGSYYRCNAPTGRPGP